MDNNNDQTNQKNPATLVCPECGNDIMLDPDQTYEVGDIIECTTCGSEIEVVSIDDSGNLSIEIIEEEK